MDIGAHKELEKLVCNSSIIVYLPCPSWPWFLLFSTAASLQIPVLIAYNQKKDYSTNLKIDQWGWCSLSVFDIVFLDMNKDIQSTSLALQLFYLITVRPNQECASSLLSLGSLETPFHELYRSMCTGEFLQLFLMLINFVKNQGSFKLDQVAIAYS